MGKHIPPRSLSLEGEGYFLSVPEAARVLGVTERCVYYRLRAGRLRGQLIDERLSRRGDGQGALPIQARHLTMLTVPLSPGCEGALQSRLAELGATTHFPLTESCICLLLLPTIFPGRLILLIADLVDAPPGAQEEGQRMFAALVRHLDDVLLWEKAQVGALP